MGSLIIKNNVLIADQNTQGKTMLTRIVAMVTKLSLRNNALREDSGTYRDFDYDNDNDNETVIPRAGGE